MPLQPRLLAELIEDLLGKVRMGAVDAPLPNRGPVTPLMGAPEDLTRSPRQLPFHFEDIPGHERMPETAPFALPPQIPDEPDIMSVLEQIRGQRGLMNQAGIQDPLRAPVVPGRPPGAPLPAFSDFEAPQLGLPPGSGSLPRIPLGGSISGRLNELRDDPIPLVQSAQALPETIPGIQDESMLAEVEDLLAKMRGQVRDTQSTFGQANRVIPSEVIPQIDDIGNPIQGKWTETDSLLDLNSAEGGGISATDYRGLVNELSQIAQREPGTALARLRASASLTVPEERVAFQNEIGGLDEASPEYLAQLRQQHAQRVRDVVSARSAAGKQLPGEIGLSQYQDAPIKQTSWGLSDELPDYQAPLRPGTPDSEFAAAKSGKLGSAVVPLESVKGTKKGDYVFVQDPASGEEMLVRVSAVRKFSMDPESQSGIKIPNKAALTSISARQGMEPKALRNWLSKTSASTISGQQKQMVELVWERNPTGPKALSEAEAVMQTTADAGAGRQMAKGEERQVSKRSLRTKSVDRATDAPVDLKAQYSANRPDRPLPPPGGKDPLKQIVVPNSKSLAKMRRNEGPAAAQPPAGGHWATLGKGKFGKRPVEPASARIPIEVGEREVVDPLGRKSKVKTRSTVEVSESRDANYTGRTKDNVNRSDATIMINLDPQSGGAKQTRGFAKAAKKALVEVSPKRADIPKEAERIVNELNKLGKNRPVILNIAGNGLETLSRAAQKLTGKTIAAKELQSKMDDYVHDLLKAVMEHKGRKFEIRQVRSGGQSGVDVAGIKAATKLGLGVPKVHTTKGYRFRGANKAEANLLDSAPHRKLLPKIFGSKKS